MKLIKEIYEFGFYENSTHFECMVFPNNDLECWKSRLAQSKGYKILKIQKKIIYEDGGEYILPVSEIIEVLPDRTGFMVIYDEKASRFSQKEIYPWFFERPHNAAVYNSDGSLRFQIENQWKDGYIFMFVQPSMKYPDFPSVILDSEIYPNNSSFFELYAIDPNSPELIATGQEIRL